MSVSNCPTDPTPYATPVRAPAPRRMLRIGIMATVVTAVVATAILIERIPRATAIRTEVAIESFFSDAPVVLLGDSIAYGAGPDTLCGQSVFNAAVPRNTLTNLVADAPAVVERIHPKSVVVAIGVNDAVLPKDSVEVWKQRYLDFITELHPRRLILVEINPLDETVPRRNPLYDRDYIVRQNAALRDIARQIGAELVPAPAHALTFDGLHPSPAGAALWRERLTRTACR